MVGPKLTNKLICILRIVLLVPSILCVNALSLAPRLGDLYTLNFWVLILRMGVKTPYPSLTSCTPGNPNIFLKQY